MSCCGNCYEYDNAGTPDFISVFLEDGSYVFTMASDASQEIKPVADLPAAFNIATAKKVLCSMYDALSEGDKFINAYHEVDADGKKTGVDLLLFMRPDGSQYFTEVGTTGEYTLGAGMGYEADEDTDWQVSEPTFFCDGGETVRVDRVYKDAVLETETITKMSDGSAHTFSGAQKIGTCSGLAAVEIQWGICFRSKTDPLADIVKGGIETTIDNSSTPPAVTATRWITSDGSGGVTAVAMADYDKISDGCC
jgi:hypothetical protein